MRCDDAIPVLEIGGTHVTAALVAADPWAVVPGTLTTAGLDADGTAAGLLDDLAGAANRLPPGHRSEWVVALPGPFDYARGIGRFRGVAKFDLLDGVDVRRDLRTRITPAPAVVRFLNDADAFGVGEYAAGAARGHDRAVCLTLGTGVGSAFLDRGRPVDTGPTVPPEGSIHLVQHDGRPLEDTVSRRAIRAGYAAATGVPPGGSVPDVHTIAERSRSGDTRAAAVLEHALMALGTVLAPIVQRFGASIVVVGGSMAASWDIVAPAVRRGLVAADPALAGLALRPAEHPAAALLGAAYWSVHLPP